MSAAGYINDRQFVEPKVRKVPTSRLLATPSGDVEGSTVAETAPFKTNGPNYPDLVSKMRSGGWVGKPLTMDKTGRLVDGHHRALAAREAGVKHIPVREQK